MFLSTEFRKFRVRFRYLVMICLILGKVNHVKFRYFRVPLFPCSVISVSVESIFRGLVSALTVYMLQIMFNIKQHISYATYNLYAK